MILKRSSTLVLFASLVGTWISGDNTLADAAPISRLLARQASSPSSPNSAPHPSPGRVQIKLVNTPPPPPSFRRSDKSSSSQPKNNDILASVPEPPKEVKVLDSWYMIEQRRRGHSLSLHGHAVLDDEDDDAGNELLDTELDGLLRPDDDDTIEGEAIEEEEEDDEQEDEDDIDAEAARIRNMYSFSLDQRNRRNQDASSLKALDEQEAEMLEEVQDQAEEEDEEEEEDWLARRGFRDSDLIPEDLEDDEEPEAEMPSSTVTNPRFQVVVSRFGGNAAAADMAAGLD
ncbi:hypothetical protein CPC16_000074 [Podila verticillata]|nr:hypothetical protein CPC16_000074 [Podila verticillata]KAI9237524.1 MAG: hypothetical protein BYD32DRAFT_416275 [Podila humilis]